MAKKKLHTLEITFRTDIPREQQARTTSLEGRPGVTVAWPVVRVENAEIILKDNKIFVFRAPDGFHFYWNIGRLVQKLKVT